jgi:ABC-type multidrug transport system ATPase subunit
LQTTVINLITGKVAATEGRIIVNGEEMPGLVKYQKLVGFVPQEDVMLRELTVSHAAWSHAHTHMR